MHRKLVGVRNRSAVAGEVCVKAWSLDELVVRRCVGHCEIMEKLYGAGHDRVAVFLPASSGEVDRGGVVLGTVLAKAVAVKMKVDGYRELSACVR
jgi:hypothetical protein